MRKNMIVPATLFLTALFPWQTKADTFGFSFSGAGVSGNVQLTYGTATDSKYPQAFEITGISGTFSDSNAGLNLVNAPIVSLQPIARAQPELTNLLAPNDFSHFAVANGLMHGFLSYDNLFYPAGSPPTATDYQVHGGFLDIYGVLFSLGDGRYANIWSNGDFSGTGNGPIDYGAAVVTAASALDYVGGGVSATAATPEPRSLGLFGFSLVIVLISLRFSKARPRINLN